MTCKNCGAPSRSATCGYCGAVSGGTTLAVGAMCRRHPEVPAEHTCTACRTPLCTDCGGVTTTPHFQRAFLFRRFYGSWAYCEPACDLKHSQSAGYERARQLHLKLFIGFSVLAGLAMAAVFAAAFAGLL